MTDELETVLNTPMSGGSRGWSAGGAFAGRLVGAQIGYLVAGRFAPAPTTEEIQAIQLAGDCMMDCEALQAAAEPAITTARNWFAGLIVGDVLGGAAMAAAGAAIGAPSELRTRAAVGAAIGGAVPLLGGWLAPIGAFLATAPPKRHQNPVSPTATVLRYLLGLSTMGGLMYAGTRMAAKRAQITP